MTSHEMTPSIEFQVAAGEQGRAFEAAAEAILRAEGWNIIDRRLRPDPEYPEIDIIAESPDEILWWIESKGSWRNTPGLERGDTVKKAIAVADDLMDLRRDMSQDGVTPVPYMVITSHIPRPGTLGEKMLRRALARESINEIRVLTMDVWK